MDLLAFAALDGCFLDAHLPRGAGHDFVAPAAAAVRAPAALDLGCDLGFDCVLWHHHDLYDHFVHFYGRRDLYGHSARKLAQV